VLFLWLQITHLQLAVAVLDQLVSQLLQQMVVIQFSQLLHQQAEVVVVIKLLAVSQMVQQEAQAVAVASKVLVALQVLLVKAMLVEVALIAVQMLAQAVVAVQPQLEQTQQQHKLEQVVTEPHLQLLDHL
jgi:hypothetical protein